VKKTEKIAILGDGGWGTALSLLAERQGHPTMLWGTFPEYVKELKEKRENAKFLPGVKIPDSIQITSNIDEAIFFGDIVIIAIPTKYIRNVLFQFKRHDLSRKITVSVAKGVENKTLLMPSQIIRTFMPTAPLVILSGPSHAEEVSRKIPTCVVVASRDQESAKKVQNALMDESFRIYASSDPLGVEVGGALKNVIAIAGGICDGLELGDNTKAALLTRGLLEITRLGARMGAHSETFFGLSGLGDLITTCFSKYGRNRHVGEQIGRGKKISEVLSGMDMVAEGVETARSAYDLSQNYKVDMPITREVYQVLYEGKPAVRALEELMMRPAKDEKEV
jgi:glycerol-3-phosphate dehydrogenase (NAD(P)+)